VWNIVKDKTDKARMIKVKRERKKKFRKPIVKEEIGIVRLVEEKKDKKEDLIEIRMIDEIIPRRFHKYLKVFEQKESERILTRKT